MAQSYSNLPDFDSLPAVKGMPQGCAWGIFDKNGTKDHLGCLNLLTPTVVQEALQEARDGISISLNWPIDAIHKPSFQRKALKHKIISFKETPWNVSAFDDEIELNTQCSSQWDSLVHFAHQPTASYYNGCRPTTDALTGTAGQGETNDTFPTLEHWHERGGLVGRGVLLDYRAYAEAEGIQYSSYKAHGISVTNLESVLKYQGTVFKGGDILILRTGLTEDLSAASAKEQEAMLGTHEAAGVQGNRETAKWIWNHHFSAVACDTIAFEVLPPILEDEGNRVGSAAELGKSGSWRGANIITDST